MFIQCCNICNVNSIHHEHQIFFSSSNCISQVGQFWCQPTHSLMNNCKTSGNLVASEDTAQGLKNITFSDLRALQWDAENWKSVILKQELMTQRAAVEASFIKFITSLRVVKLSVHSYFFKANKNTVTWQPQSVQSVISVSSFLLL
jgi:hypothetical protein